jgi:hypothetical protein
MAAYFQAVKEQYGALAVKLSAADVTWKLIPACIVDGMLPAANLEHRILEKLKGKPGGLSLIELRESLGPQKRVLLSVQRQLKADFDEAVLALYRDRRVYLDRHDHPLRLSDTERQNLVCDGVGNYYVGITLRGDID